MIVYDLLNKISKVARNFLTKDYAKAFETQFSETEMHISGYQYDCFLVDANDITLKKWENFMGIIPENPSNLVDRRNKIITTLNSRGACTPQFLEQQFAIYDNGEVEIIENFPSYYFSIKFVNTNGVPENIVDYYYLVDVNKPSHLGYGFEFEDIKNGYVSCIGSGINFGRNSYLPVDIL